MNDADRLALYEAAQQERKREGWRSVPLHRPAREIARTSDVETSHAAAAHAPDAKANQRREVLALHARHPGGLTDDEVSYLAGTDLWRRCSDLRKLGHLAWLMTTTSPSAPTGVPVPVTRKARSGRQGRVSILTPLGRAEAPA